MDDQARHAVLAVMLLPLCVLSGHYMARALWAWWLRSHTVEAHMKTPKGRDKLMQGQAAEIARLREGTERLRLFIERCASGERTDEIPEEAQEVLREIDDDWRKLMASTYEY